MTTSRSIVATKGSLGGERKLAMRGDMLDDESGIKMSNEMAGTGIRWI